MEEQALVDRLDRVADAVVIAKRARAIALQSIILDMFSGILLALRERDRTGRGQAVDIALFDAILAAMTLPAGIAFATEVDEVSAWFLGAMYALLAGIGITAGVSTRKTFRRASS